MGADDIIDCAHNTPRVLCGRWRDAGLHSLAVMYSVARTHSEQEYTRCTTTWSRPPRAPPCCARLCLRSIAARCLRAALLDLFSPVEYGSFLRDAVRYVCPEMNVLAYSLIAELVFVLQYTSLFWRFDLSCVNQTISPRVVY